MTSLDSRNLWRMIAVPALITLAVTVLRLVGELNGWPSLLFGREAGGGGALVGIVWLPPIFGIYFTRKLQKAGHEPPRAGRIALYAFLGLIAFLVTTTIAPIFGILFPFNVLLLGLAGIVGIAVSVRGWPVLGKTLAWYGLAARVPVVVITFFAMSGSWGTHYDASPPGFPEGTGLLTEFLLLGVLPQLTLWIAYTIVAGALFAALALKVAARNRVVPPVTLV